MSQDAGKPEAAAKPAKPAPRRKRRLFTKQPIMLRVVWALIPLLGAAVYFFGWRVLWIVAWCLLGGVATEWLTSRRRGQPVSMAVFVTVGLYALSLPPNMPEWKALVGIVVAILFGKEVFGGFGRNPFNPAIVGRAFVYTCFPADMTQQFTPTFGGFPGGLAHWHWSEHLSQVPAYIAEAGRSAADAISQATPLLVYKQYGVAADPWQLFLGNIGQTFTKPDGSVVVMSAGSVGEVSAALILLAGIYLMASRTSNWRLTVSMLAGAAAFSGLAHWATGGQGDPTFVPPVPFTLCAGALIYAAVFMVTDPVSAPKEKGAMYAYGLIIGALVVWLRWRSSWSGAVAFAILLGNIVAPLLDRGAKALRARLQPKPAVNAAGTSPGSAEASSGGGE